MRPLLSFTCLLFLLASASAGAETLPPLEEGKAPQTHADLWKGFDPRAEPLDVEILHEWEEDGVVLRVLRYRIGVFQGETAMMAAIYGFPKGGRDLPGLLNIHGGGQYASYQAVFTNAKRGYATITIAWAGRISAPDYRVSPREVQLFWDGKTEDPLYRITTDWGALDAYHAPSRYGQNAFTSIPDGSQPWTLDDVPSPRNNSWFLCTLGARRALTFLEQQPEVDGNRLGVYGHSMGGKLTVLTTGADSRVKAAAPSCGGISDRYNEDPLHHNTVGDSPSLKAITCPTIFLMPSNDFHGHINDLVVATEELGTDEWRVTCSAHINHQDLPENEVATQLWFDQHLQGTFTWPETPQTSLELKTADGTPRLMVNPDTSRPILGVEVFYTQQGIEGGDRTIMQNRIHRFWHAAKPEEVDGAWTAALPLAFADRPLWVYANVLYRLDEPVTGAGYYYGTYTAERFNLSSLVHLVKPDQLQEAGVEITLQPSEVIETFEGDWERDWFRLKADDWSMRTNKLYHPLWAAPPGATLRFEVQAGEANTLVVGLDDHAAEIAVTGGDGWQTVTLSPSDFLDAGEQPRPDWDDLRQLRFGAAEHLRSKERGDDTRRLVGGPWKGEAPRFRYLRWGR